MGVIDDMTEERVGMGIADHDTIESGRTLGPTDNGLKQNFIANAGESASKVSDEGK